ncbi:hypothetical protein V500_00055 [Pseudogymnoascus sp. VKM F-4518 (FW-2643)]|nr:hypothetical protein V500_00055 [Pseudogymnoascus sp. VKM F-4518 (FW-2643)]
MQCASVPPSDPPSPIQSPDTVAALLRFTLESIIIHPVPRHLFSLAGAALPADDYYPSVRNHTPSLAPLHKRTIAATRRACETRCRGDEQPTIAAPAQPRSGGSREAGGIPRRPNRKERARRVVDVGYGVDIEALREAHAQPQTVEKFLVESSKDTHLVVQLSSLVQGIREVTLAHTAAQRSEMLNKLRTWMPVTEESQVLRTTAAAGKEERDYKSSYTSSTVLNALVSLASALAT